MLCFRISTKAIRKPCLNTPVAGLFMLLAAFVATGCNMSVSHPKPTGLAVQAVIPAHVLTAAQKAVEKETSALGVLQASELQQVTYNVVLVDDAELINGGPSRERLVLDLEAGNPAPANDPAYLTRSFTWSPGQAASVEINSLNPDARYLVVLKAELVYSQGSPLTVFGFTRVLTRAGRTTAAQVRLGGTPAPLVGALLEWYGIAVQLEAALLGGPELSNLPPLITNQQEISFTATAEPGATFVYGASGPTTIADSEVQDNDLSGSELLVLSGLQEGIYTVSVRYRSADGIESEPAAFVVEIDLTPPAAPVFTQLPPNPTNSATPSFTVTGEPGATFVYSVSGATAVAETSIEDTEQNGSLTITLPSLNEGTHTVSVYLIDPAGNTGPESVFSFEINTALPDAPAFSSFPPSPSNNPNAGFVVTGLPGGTFIYSVSGATLVEDTTVEDTDSDGIVDFTVTLLEGLNTVSVAVEDAAGNRSGAVTYDLVVDTTPPPAPTNVFSLDLQGTPPNQFTYNDMPIFTWSGSGEPGAEWEYSTDGGMTWLPTAVESATLGPLAAGIHQFRVRERDLAGNLSGEAPLIEFEYIPVGVATITITNPTVPTFTLSPAGFTLDVNGNGGWPALQVVEVVPGAGVTITAYEWVINNEILAGEGDSTLSIEAAWATDPLHPTVMGVNALTLIVVINGTPYSDNFFFSVEEN